MTTLIKTLSHNTSDHKLAIQDHPAPTSPCESVGLHILEVYATSFTNGELLWPEVNELAQPVPGFDVAGKIMYAPESSHFKKGDPVYGYTHVTRPGAAREQQVALEAELALKPDILSWEEAATVPLSALTAWQALFEKAGIAPPSGPGADDEAAEQSPRVLITAASGGVGVWAVQLARLAGAYVVATCGPRNIDFVKDLGANEVLDYTITPVGAWTAEDRREREFDVVIDCKGGATLSEAWTCVKAGGFMNSVAEPADDKRPNEGVADSVRSLWFIVEPHGSQLALISELIKQGRCRPVTDSVWAFDDWEKAFERLASGHARGKVVLRIKQ